MRVYSGLLSQRKDINQRYRLLGAYVLGVSDGMSYRIIRELNRELEAKGFHTVHGRVSRKYFEESYYGVTHEKEVV